MEQTRQQKIARLLQKELGDIFLLFGKSHQGTLISVSEVRISPDLSIAHVYISIFPDGKAAEILQAVEDNAKAIRFELGNRVDKTLDYLENIDNLLKK